MTSESAYDADELRALAVALDTLDPQDPDDWEGDADAFAASVAQGRERLERRGLATFARDGSATVEPADAAMLHAFLAPDAVVEAWVVDGTVASEREWYVGAEVTVVADPAAGVGSERELATIDTHEVLDDVIAFLDVRGVDAEGAAMRIAGDEIGEFAGREPALGGSAPPAPRLMNVTAAWEQRPEPRELQLLDAGRGGLWIVATVDDDADTGSERLVPGPDVVDLVPATWAAVVTRILAVLTR